MSVEIEPGMYLVGRDDGTRKEVFVRVNGDGTMDIPSAGATMVLANYDWEGWWWQRMEVPKTCPNSFDNLQPSPKQRGDL